jgi:HPr kinase/phosphorylase
VSTATALHIPVSRLLADEQYDLKLDLIEGKEGLEHPISSSRIQKPGLALTGFTEHLHPERVQVFGNTEISYLKTLSGQQQAEVLSKLFDSHLACVVVTKGLEIPVPLLEGCRRNGLALMRTPLVSSAFISQVQSFLEEALTATGSLHGVLIDVFGVGVLLLGKSGIGKSEIARPPPRRRRHRQPHPQAVRRVRPRQRPHPAPHGDSRPRHPQHQGPLRRRRGARPQED